VGEATSTPAPWKALVAAGATAGLVSAVFGVGGGLVIVPLLVAFAGYDTKRATTTSLAAVILIAGWGAIAQGVLGNVDVTAALLIGLPAMFGVTAGVAIKRRVSNDQLEIGFAALLVVVAIALVLR
jgi:uncharacterized membrane protein YfcA